MIKLRLFNSILILFIITAVGGCKKKEGIDLPLTVSRLYVSISGLDSLATHTLVFDPSDVSPFARPYEIASFQGDAQGIFFDQYAGYVFQAGTLNRGIKTFKVDEMAHITEQSSFADSGLVSPKEIAYDFRTRDSSFIFVSNYTDNTIRGYLNPAGLSGTRIKPNKQFELTDRSWGLCISKDSLFVTVGDNGVQFYPKISKADSTHLPQGKSISINGADILRGIHYIERLDILLLTDIGAEGNVTDGKIYIIEKANAAFNSGGVITPTRIISGAATSLGNPVDIDFDSRTDKNLIYVAEKGNRKILVFKLADAGNSAPQISHDLNGTPEAIYLDARE